MGPGAGCGLLAPASRGEGAAASTVIPSNLGNGPAIVRQHHAGSHGNVPERSKLSSSRLQDHLRCNASSSVGARPA